MATFYNQATLTYQGGVANSNVVTGELVEVVTANKTATTATYTPGEQVTYLVNIINSGNTALNALTVTDDLGAYTVGTQTYVPLTYVNGSALYYVNGVPSAPPTVTSAQSLTVTGLTVPAGGNATLVYRAVANGFANPSVGGSITNLATVTGNGIATPVEATATLLAESGARLSITKAISPSVVSENDRLTYTFVISNTGNEAAVATDALSVTDTFDPALSNIVVTLNGAVWPETGNYTYDESTGAFATVAGSVTVPAATYTQDAATGEWLTVPGTAVIQVSGTI